MVLIKGLTRYFDAPKDQAGGNDAADGSEGASNDSAPNWDDVLARIAEIPEDRAADLENALKGNKALGSRLIRTVRQSTILSEAERLAAEKSGADGKEPGKKGGRVAVLESELTKAASLINRLTEQLELKEQEDLAPEEIEARKKDKTIRSLEAKLEEYDGVLTRAKRREAVDAILEFAVDDEEGLGFTDKQVASLRDLAADIVDDQGDPDVLKAQLLKFAAQNRKEQKTVTQQSKSELETLREEVASITRRLSGETTTVTTNTGSEVKSGGAMPFKTLEEKWLDDPATYGEQYKAERKKLGMEFN